MDQARHSELKILRWTDRIQGILAGEKLGPIRANLDLTNLCSHNCTWCEPIDFRKATIADKRHTLPTKVAMDVIADLHELDCRCVVFSGGGEPTLHQDFGLLLNYAHELGMRTWLVTHGGYLERWYCSVAKGADHVRVSLDASSEAEHQAVHQPSRTDEFERILAGIRALLAMDKRPEVGIAYVVTPGKNDSVFSLCTAVDLADSLGVDYLHFRPASGQSTAESWLAVVRVIEDIQARQPKTPIWVMGKRLSDVFTQRDFSRCYAAVTMATIGANGDVSACCDERGKTFGNVHETRFRDVWLGEKHRRIAGMIAPQLCPRCLLCGFNRSVEHNIVLNEALPELL